MRCESSLRTSVLFELQMINRTFPFRFPFHFRLHSHQTKPNSPFESRFPINIGITGHVATTGVTVNIHNAYDDQRFDPSVDESATFKHKSILCMAIKNSLGQIIGVIQLINKFDELVSLERCRIFALKKRDK